MREFRPTPWQIRLCGIPSAFDVAALGGRGLGKSWGLAFQILQYVEKVGELARAVYLRQSVPALLDFQLICRRLFKARFGKAARENKNEHLWTFPAGGTLEINQLADYTSLDKYIGRSIGLLIVDQAEQFGSPELIDAMRSNLRSEGTEPPRFVISAHPGSRGDAWIRERYVLPSSPWVPFEEKSSGRTFVRTSGTYRDNLHLGEDYRAQLEAATATDSRRRLAWIEGDFLTGGFGAFFGDVFAETRNVLVDWPPSWRDPECQEDVDPLQAPSEWALWLAHDYGSARPSATYVLATPPPGGAVGPDKKYYAGGSVIALDELATYDGELNIGTRWTLDRLAGEIRFLAQRWRIPARGVGDPAIWQEHAGSDSSIGAQLRARGVDLEPAPRVGRRDGWERLRGLMAAAGTRDAAFYICRRCRYLLKTLPHLPRSQRDPDDCDTNGPDHGADAVRFGVLHDPGPRGWVGELRI